MINSFVVLSLIASVALAQVPSGLSSQCDAFYKSLNTNPSLAGCTTSLTAATAAFAPGASTPSTGAVSTALTSLCSDTTKCSESAVRTALAQLRTECATEFSSGNADVLQFFDSLYTLVPLRGAICAKGEDGGWCLNTLSKSVDDGTKSNVQKYLTNKDNTAANSTTFCSSNLVFGFIQPTWKFESMCTVCTNKILSEYINWQSNTPYTPGLENSKLLCGEEKLYEAVGTTCGKDFLGGAVQAAGGISAGFGASNNAATPILGSGKAIVLAFLGAAASFATLL